jgi:Transposase zinc-ribbon domain
MAEPPDEDADGQARAYLLLEQLRWGGDTPPCPHCGVAGRSRYLRPRDGFSRRTRTGRRSQRRVWKCGACRRQFSVLTGTILQGTRIDVRVWIAVIGAYAADCVLDAALIADRYGLSPESARHLRHRLDAALPAAETGR